MLPCTLRPGVLGSALVVSTLAISHSTPANTQHEPRQRHHSALRWQPCGDAYPGTECAVASVPLDHGDARGARTGIQLARVAGSNAKATLFVNPGGPGGSGVDMVLNGFGAYLSELLGGRFDVVGFDPRGVGSSEPLICFGGSEQAFLEVFEGVPWFPYLPEQESAYFEAWSSLPEHCRGQRIRAHMSTGDSARDLEQLRGLVGDERLSYLGFSYGSFLGQTYANLFPERVGALVIDGVVDPALYSSGNHAFSTSTALPDELDELLRLCDEAGSDCALAGEEGAGVRYEIVESALLDEPFPLWEDESYAYDIFISDIASSLYAPDFDWGGPEGFGAFVAALYDVALGEPGALERAAAIREAIAERWAPVPTFSGHDNGVDAFYGTTCADSEFPELLAEHVNLGIVAGRESPLGSSWWWGYTPCASWPLARDRYTGPWTAETAAPVLIVGNYFDGVTDHAGAEAAARLLPNSRLLSFAGLGHTAFGYSECVTDYTVSYLLEGTLPPEGTVCPANPSPFVPPPPAPELAGGGSESLARAARPGVAAARALRSRSLRVR